VWNGSAEREDRMILLTEREDRMIVLTGREKTDVADVDMVVS
jgi:hypothetical protein